MRRIIVVCFILLQTILFAQNSFNKESTYSVAFSPNNGAESLIIKAIDSAESSIEIACYLITNQHIVDAILKADKRHISIRLIVDYDMLECRGSLIQELEEGIWARWIMTYKIFHHKFMIIDKKTIQTGSFNYSEAAEKQNAENVLVIWDNPELAALYSIEFEKLWIDSINSWN